MLTPLNKSERRLYSTQGMRNFDLCQCHCGNVLWVERNNRKRGNTTSCGCAQRAAAARVGASMRKHGMAKTRVYAIWHNLVSRCTNQADKSFPRYGGRGIKVCEQWRYSFESFLADMGEPPTVHHQIDRIDNSGGYWPENCRWATRQENARNKRNNRRLEWRGQTKCVAEWAEHFGVTESWIRRRLAKDLQADAIFSQLPQHSNLP